MPMPEGTMMKQSTLTGAGAVLFVSGIVLLLTVLFREASHGGPLLWVALAVLAASVACWFAAARAETG
jgi:hypothetical protein